MSGVVLRCPNCGTTRGTPGACEACHEAQVRYYCTNHTPGRWLDAPACGQCGARFGGPDRAASPAPPPAAPQPRSRPAGRPAAAPPPGRPGPGAPPGRPGAWPPGTEGPGMPHGAPITNLRDLLLAAARARRTAGPPPRDLPEESPRPRAPGGCLVRFLFLMVFLFLAMVGGMFVLGGSVLRLFVPF